MKRRDHQAGFASRNRALITTAAAISFVEFAGGLR